MPQHVPPISLMEDYPMRRTLCTTAAAGTMLLALAAPAAAQSADRDCPDFASQAEAQAAYDAAPGDPERLDRDGDGIACEDGEGGGAAAPAPQTGNETTASGELPFTGPRETAIMAATGTALLGAGYVLMRAGRRQEV